MGIEAEMGQCSILVKIDEKMTVLRMGLPTVESLSGLQESIFSLFRGPQLNSHKKCKKLSNFIKLPLLAHVGPMAVWGPLGCCHPALVIYMSARTFGSSANLHRLPRNIVTRYMARKSDRK